MLGTAMQSTPRSPDDDDGIRAVQRRVRGLPTSDGAGVRLVRVIGQPTLGEVDPFLLLDEFGTDRPEDYIAGFPDHPHRGFETVTYMLEGRMRHRDNHGHEGVLGPGGVQWMTAGRGIIHSEMPEQQEGRLRGFQLWINLPAREKMTAPRYQDIAAESIPEVEPAAGVSLRVIAGRFVDVCGPVTGIATDPLYVDLSLAAGKSIDVPLAAGHNAFAYVYEDSVMLGPSSQTSLVERGELAVLDLGDHVHVGAGPAGGRLIIVAGKPLAEPVAKHGPFVMNTPEQIVEAIRDSSQAGFETAL